MSRITGRIEVLINGVPVLNKEGAVASGIGISGEPGFELEPVMGDTGLHGFKETSQPAKLEVTVTDRDDISLSTFAQIRDNGTVIFRAAGTGKVYTMQGATCARNFSVTGGEGETPMVFYAPYWLESAS
jgi:hypothetical protein